MKIYNKYSHLVIFFFCLFIILLVSLKIRHYEWHSSSLIGIWEGFANLNPGYIEKGTVIFKDGGYDGEFFYLNSRFLFDPGLDFPKVDSFYFRFHRIGLSLVAGILSYIVGFQYYAIVTLVLLVFLTVISFLLLSKQIDSKADMLLYLFNPFVINSTLLLVSDSFFVSILGLGIYFIIKSGLISSKQTKIDKQTFFVAVLFFGISIFVRETGIFFTASIVLVLLYRREYFKSFLMSLPIIFFIGFIYILKNLNVDFVGTNPLGFIDMIDWPLFGFFKSLKIGSIKGLIILPVFSFFILLIFTLKNITDIESLILHLPLLGIILIASIAEQGYWNSFDNITRMFAPVMVWIIFLKKRYETYNNLYLQVLHSLFIALVIFRFFNHKGLAYILYP